MGDRARKSGIGADIEKKLEQRYEEAEKEGTMEAVLLWINASTQGDHASIPSAEFKDLHRSLRDGVMLCKLINKLLEAAGGKAVKFSAKAASPFVARTNIENFGKGCEAYGLNKEAVIQSDDLYEGRKGAFLNVINGLHSLAMLANSKGFSITYTGQQTKMLDN